MIAPLLLLLLAAAPREIEVTLRVPAFGYGIKIHEVRQVGNEIWCLSEVCRISGWPLEGPQTASLAG